MNEPNITHTPGDEPKLNHPVKISGYIEKLQVTRQRASFVITKGESTAMGIIAIAAASVGIGGQAVATASAANDTQEEADYLEFEIDGKPIKGWVWRNTFVNGNKVDVVAEWTKGFWDPAPYYNLYGIAREWDKMIALYPHCSRGRWAHFRNALKWWWWGCIVGWSTILGLLVIIGTGYKDLFTEGFLISSGIGSSFFSLMAIHFTYRWMPYVRLSEKVFETLGFKNPKEIDLKKTSKAQKTANDRKEYGIFYFRY